MNIYELETNDFHMTRGDTKYLSFVFYDEDQNEENVSFADSEFNVRDPLTDTVIDELTKEKDDGIYHSDASSFPTGVTIANNQVVVEIDAADTVDLEDNVYPFDLQLTVSSRVFTVHGNLIIKRDHTE